MSSCKMYTENSCFSINMDSKIACYLVLFIQIFSIADNKLFFMKMKDNLLKT